MKALLILIFVVVGIPILKAMGSAVKKTKEQNDIEDVVFRGFLRIVKKNNDEMNLNYDKEIANILELKKDKVFRLFGKVIDFDDPFGATRERFKEYAIKFYINELVNLLEDLGQFRAVRKIDRGNILDAAKRNELRNYRFEYSVDKWVIETNTNFYIVLATFSKDRISYFAFGMVDY